MATYRGSPFEAGIGPTDGDIVLFAACPPPEDLGFEPATGHWRKQLPISEVQAVWESRPVGTFRGERCMVLDDLGDRLHIGYLGHNGYQAEQLGYWQVDRGVYELVAARSEVSDIIEERTEYPRHGASPGRARGVRPAGELPAAGVAAGSGAVPAAGATRSGQLPARPARFFRAPDAPGYQRDTAPGYQPAGPASGQFSWSDPGLPAQHPSGPGRPRPVRANRPASVRPHPGPVRAHSAASVRPHPLLVRANRPAPVRPHPRPVRANRPAPVRPHPRPVRANRPAPCRPSSTGPGQPPSTRPAPSSTVRAADSAGPGLPGGPDAAAASPCPH